MTKKRKITLVLAAIMALSIAGTSLAAETNPFDDIPANHWAYDSIQTLAKAGIVDGYGDAAFKGDKALTRYEMAVIVARAMSKSKSRSMDQETKDALGKLKNEFSNELKNLGVRVDKLEKTTPSFKITADGRVRYWQNLYMQGNSSNNAKLSTMQERVRLNLSGDVTDNVKFFGIVTSEHSSNTRDAAGIKTSTRDYLHFDQAEFVWTNKNLSLSAGRALPTVGQGLIWCYWGFDGIYATYDFGRVAVSGGYGDLNGYNAFLNSRTVNAAVANVAIKASDKVTLTAAYLKALNPNNTTTYYGGYDYNFKQVAYGANAKLGEFTLTAETIKNHANNLPDGAQKTGWWTKLQWKGIDVAIPGSYGISFDYMKMGNWAVDSEIWGNVLYVPGGDGVGMHGAKGYGVTVNYVLAKNIDAEVAFYKLKPYDSAQAGFDSYKNLLGITTNFRF